MYLTKEKKKKIAVMRGGANHQAKWSMDTGAQVLMTLEPIYDTKDILVDKNSRWVVEGKYVRPEHALWDVDLVFNALHGSYGEDGTLQEILEAHTKPYTGSGSFSSFSSLNKHIAKKFFKAHGLKTPLHRIIHKDAGTAGEISLSLFSTFPLPLIVKPVHGGGLYGIYFVSDFNELEEAIQKVFTIENQAIVEEYIKGDVISCAVIEKYRDYEFYSTLPVEMHLPPSHVFTGIDNGSVLEYSVPARIGLKDNEKIQEYAKLSHQVLGLRHYSQSDFIISPMRGVFLLETNALPHLGLRSPFISALEAVGSSRDEFIHHVISLV